MTYLYEPARDTSHHIAKLHPTEEKMTPMTVVHLPTLTERQRAILDFIAECISDPDRRYPPSVREIAEAVGMSSTSSVHYQLGELEAAGMIRRAGNRSRAITLTVELPAA